MLKMIPVWKNMKNICLTRVERQMPSDLGALWSVTDLEIKICAIQDCEVSIELHTTPLANLSVIED